MTYLRIGEKIESISAVVIAEAAALLTASLGTDSGVFSTAATFTDVFPPIATFTDSSPPIPHVVRGRRFAHFAK